MRIHVLPVLKDYKLKEINKPISIPWISKPSYSHPEKPQFMGYVGNLLTATTGLRLGELQALKLNDIHLDAEYITVKCSWNNRLNKIIKNQSKRKNLQ